MTGNLIATAPPKRGAFLFKHTQYMSTQKQILPCLCMTCGVRNDFTHPAGFCQNGHDNWLEYSDVVERNEFFKVAVEQAGMAEDKFIARFMDGENTFISQANYHNKVVIEMRGGVISRVISNIPIAYTVIDFDGLPKHLGSQRPDKITENISSEYAETPDAEQLLRAINF